MVLLLDEIEFLFDPLASVRHREFQPASSPAATAATLQEKEERKRTDSISYVYAHDNGNTTEDILARTSTLKPYRMRNALATRISRIRQQAVWPSLCGIVFNLSNSGARELVRPRAYLSLLRRKLHGTIMSKLNKSNKFRDSWIWYCVKHSFLAF